MVIVLSFFISSRRRHTRSKRDWSSDVCSSDLEACCSFNSPKKSRSYALHSSLGMTSANHFRAVFTSAGCTTFWSALLPQLLRSEERRVGKECSSGSGRYPRHNTACDCYSHV